MTSIVYEKDGAVGVVTLAKPPHNLMDNAVLDELASVYARAVGEGCRALLLRSSMRHFCAGADLGTIAGGTWDQDALKTIWESLENVPIPTVAAVHGAALGGGFELALMCDIILAADTAKFGQPEIKLGVIPGAGGTQRLTRAVGKAKAMDLCLTGRMMDAAEAERAGLVARIVPAASLLEEAMKAAETIASMSLPSVMTAKESVNRAYETTLTEGLRFERRVFHALFATEDQKEGMAAFVDKRAPAFKQR